MGHAGGDLISLPQRRAASRPTGKWSGAFSPTPLRPPQDRRGEYDADASLARRSSSLLQIRCSPTVAVSGLKFRPAVIQQWAGRGAGDRASLSREERKALILAVGTELAPARPS
jgi:hypothetical protein